jgi:hypothetical protein
VLNIAMPKIRLQGPRVVAGFGECEAAGVTQHPAEPGFEVAGWVRRWDDASVRA